MNKIGTLMIWFDECKDFEPLATCLASVAFESHFVDCFFNLTPNYGYMKD